jgi:hypothetical protein
MVNGKVPGAALAGTDTVIVIVEEDVAGLGLIVAVTPFGKPVTLKVTAPALVPLMVIEQDPLLPGWTTKWSQADKVKPLIVRVRFDCVRSIGRTWP